MAVFNMDLGLTVMDRVVPVPVPFRMWLLCRAFRDLDWVITSYLRITGNHNVDMGSQT